ncbi:flagellar biosynthesis protein FlgA, partial [Paracidovorax avenae]
MSPHSHLPFSRPAPCRARALARVAGAALLP